MRPIAAATEASVALIAPAGRERTRAALAGTAVEVHPGVPVCGLMTSPRCSWRRT